MRLEWNKEDNTISIGDLVFKNYVHWKSWKEWALYVVNNQEDQVLNVSVNQHPKTLNKQLADTLGCSPTILYNNFKKLQYKAFVVPYKDILMKIAFSRRGVNCAVLQDIKRSHDKLIQARKDGLDNLLPIIAKTGMAPHELKAQFKKDWKVIAKNSLNKNKALAKADFDNLGKYSTLPTALLNYSRHLSYESLKFAEYNFKGSWSKLFSSKAKHKGASTSLRLFNDVQRMAEQLGEDVNPKWTPRRVKEEHDRVAIEINARRYSPEPIKCLEDVPLKNFYHEGYLATLLTSAKAIADEGTTMGHCVGGYIEAVRRGEYLVYSVTKEGERSSTLGVTVIPEGSKILPRFPAPFRFNQQYGRFNAYLKSEAEKEIGKLIVENLNKEVVDKEQLAA